MSPNEADTRAELIDPLLKQSGWGKITASRIHREWSCPGRILPGGRREKPRPCDYVLIYHGQFMAVVEAKKEALNANEGVRQSIEYAERLDCRYAYATNGHEIYQIDRKTGEQDYVDRILSPDELWQRIVLDTCETDIEQQWRSRFSAIASLEPANKRMRYYQTTAVKHILNAIAKGKKRILLTMATGTGKTFVAAQVAYKLFESRWTLSTHNQPDEPGRRPRILFLADRNILADQSYLGFDAFFKDGAMIRLNPASIGENTGAPKNGHLFFTIYQTAMASGHSDDIEEAQPNFCDYSPDFFDLIIVDECHRGGARAESNWRSVLEHFSSAVQLGMTATPKNNDNVNTYQYFGEPVYTYSLKQGINDGFLTPFKVHVIVGTTDDHIHTPDDEVLAGSPQMGACYTASQMNLTIEIKEREKARVKYWMDKIGENEKALVFCKTNEHAALIRDLVNQYASETGKNSEYATYCARVTSSDGKDGEKDLMSFKDNDKNRPLILTTSRKLSTGVDAHGVRHIILMRPCNDMVEFKQIIGRGTRLDVERGKDYFTLFDFDKAHYQFNDPSWDGEPISIDEENEDTILHQDDATLTTQPTGDSDAQASETDHPRPEKIKIKLSGHAVREISHIATVLYWGQEGKPITAAEFIKTLYAKLPAFFKDEEQLRQQWKLPETRAQLLESMEATDITFDDLKQIRGLVGAENSDIYDVLAYIAFDSKMLTREERAQHAKARLGALLALPNKSPLIEFILKQYTDNGIETLSADNLSVLVKMHYDDSLHDAENQYGTLEEINHDYIECQKYLYDSTIQSSSSI
ncbi:MAG: DEAD/DEAH box helicase family protein [Gammaproteobacteria bacterium]|nr:DEAD/DEAH box helicase family protein [Gammaproteobacteria bacterium]